MFGLVDYLVFAVTLLISVGIGLYVNIFGKSDSITNFTDDVKF